MTGSEIRQKYRDFFKSKDHAVIPTASLIPENDPTTLFTGSGMQPLIPYLLGEKHPLGKRLVNFQKCFRTEDIDEVGDNRHNTFFEMLGNWSLGDYFKKEQLRWFFEFLTQKLKINPDRLYITVFRGKEDIGIPRDEESVKIWKELFLEKDIKAKDIDFAGKKGMQDGRIFYYDERKNWWSRSGIPADMPLGEPGGPDSEVFYDLGEDLKRHENSPFRDRPCHLNCDCGRFIEIGNNVFMEYIKTEKGFEKLKQKNVDFGGGLERITMISQGKDNIFETDLFINIIKKIEELSEGKKYREDMKAFEVISDHLKAATFIMGDDKAVVPSNTGQGYVVRRLIRRAVRYARQLGIEQDLWTQEIAEIIVRDYKDIYPELEKNLDFIIEQLKEEEIKFKMTLEKGLKEFEGLLDKSKSKEISGREAFYLYETFGFPVELTEEMAEEKGFGVDKEGFERAFKKHQELSRTASAGKFKSGLADTSEKTTKLHTATHLLLASLRRVLEEHVVQKGSNITPERLRFDFLYSEKLTEEQKQRTEDLVNEVIKKGLPVNCKEISLEEAKKENAVGVFREKYGKKVKVYTIGKGNDIFSKEICAGPHVKNTSELGKFKIIKEESSSAGVRRIKAILE